ncbi:rRNA maturation RNase YbeY [Pontiella agarivorans]|uniref:Endoribonuclease YbeY n=1 Tax=Pontiella agarivorans TaxID=3038953 RepID=A0ABU5MSP7_9BACT|nr:rRNA maturation RNase YbeY [Pontiella agarivorans]MDZ8117218.1 rRNA maturation RNase YbeY [Pontiella agarivorans]
MIITLLNQQTRHPLNLEKIQKLAEWLGKRLAPRTSEPWNEVCVVLTDDPGIIPANLEYFGKERPTDVISFRYDPIPGEDEGYTGDLIINIDRAVQRGPEEKGADYELALYIAHGFDHLSGAEDNTPEKKKAMLDTETAWIEEIGKEAISNLFE